MPIDEGTRLGLYEIPQLRAGDMGELYLTEPTRLYRKVALKTRPADLDSHRDRLRRFAHQPTAAAARSISRTSRTFTNR